MATFSEIDITFTDFFVTDSTVNVFNIQILNTSTDVFFKLREGVVTTRSGDNEFTQGDSAVTQAQFFKAAIDADYVAGGEYECTISGAVVTIKSTVNSYQFQNIIVGQANLPRFTTVIRNYSIPVTDTTGLLLARSNYYLTRDITTEAFIEVKMYFRSGEFADPLGTPNYIKKIFRPSVNWEYFDVLISRFALDFLNPKPVYSATNGLVNSLVGSVVATTITTSTDISTTPTERLKNALTTRGYSNYSEGINLLNDKIILLTSLNNQILKGGQIMIPLIAGNILTIKNDQGVTLETETVVEGDKAENSIVYYFYDTGSSESTFFTVNDTYIFEVVEECKYTPQIVYFLNKFGVFESFTFFKAKESNVSFTEEGEFKNNFVLGGTYDITRHLYRSGNKNARETITLNTGYINETQNEVIRGILNSDHVFFNNAGTFVPVNVDTKSLKVLSKINDKLINYTIDFKNSFDTVQNV